MQMPIIERRKIEAELIKLVHDELSLRFGAETSKAILTAVIRKSAIEQGRRFAEAEPAPPTMASFVKLYDLWKMNGALEMDVRRQDERHFDFNVTRCRYAEMYREMGLAELGHILSCNRDGTFCQGYDPKITLKRTQTIMQGAACCDFRYERDEKAGSDK